MKMIGVRLPDPLLAQLVAAAEREANPISSLVRRFCVEGLARDEQRDERRRENRVNRE
jgi:hypothetical protein